MKMGLSLFGLLVLSGLGIASAPVPAAGQAAQAQGSASASAQTNAGQTSAGAATSTNASAQAGQSNANLASGTALNAALNAPVDSKKAKVGDSVTAHTTEAVKADGKTVIPKGAKLVGHVTQASARAKGEAKGESEAALGVVFDKAILKNGQEVPISASIQALAAAQSAASVAGSDLDAAGSAGVSSAGSAAGGGRGAVGGVAGAAGGAVSGVTNTAARTAGGTVGAVSNTTAGLGATSQGAVGGLNSAGQLSSNSRGVFGLNGLNLNAAAANETQGSVITSTGKSVHLDSGTRMLLVTGAGSGAPGEAKKPEGGKGESKPEPKSQPQKQ